MRCDFCEEFKKDYFAFTGSNRILWKTNNFFVFPGLGQIVEGYLLIATESHHISIGAVPTEFFNELEDVIKKVRGVLKEQYSNPLFFEHGPASSSKRGGCCIEHAHLHAMPVQLDVLTDLSQHFLPRKITSFLELKRLYDKGSPYFFIETNSSERYVFKISEQVPSQYIRRIIAEKIGKPDHWDWAVYLGIEEMKNTLQKLSDKF